MFTLSETPHGWKSTGFEGRGSWCYCVLMVWSWGKNTSFLASHIMSHYRVVVEKIIGFGGIRKTQVLSQFFSHLRSWVWPWISHGSFMNLLECPSSWNIFPFCNFIQGDCCRFLKPQPKLLLLMKIIPKLSRNSFATLRIPLWLIF